jgi:hypothetical protein
VPHRAARLARVIASACESREDVRTAAELCRAAPVGVAAGTFRKWCSAEGIRAGQAVRFARVLRAVWLGQIGLTELKVRATPTAILVNRSAVVQRVDAGWLDEARQTVLKNALKNGL